MNGCDLQKVVSAPLQVGDFTIKTTYPLVICYIAIENGPFIVDLPMIYPWKMVIFHRFLYVYHLGYIVVRSLVIVGQVSP